MQKNFHANFSLIKKTFSNSLTEIKKIGTLKKRIYHLHLSNDLSDFVLLLVRTNAMHTKN